MATTDREREEMAKEKKREKREEWQAKQAHLNVMVSNKFLRRLMLFKA